MEKKENQFKVKLICKTTSDSFYYIDNDFIQYILSIPINKFNSYRLNIDFKCKDKNNHQQLINRLNDLNTKYYSLDANIMLCPIGPNKKTTNLETEDNYIALANYLTTVINSSYNIILALKIDINNLKNNIRLLNSPEIDETFLNWLEIHSPNRFKKKGGYNETMYINLLKGEKNNSELDINWITKELPDDINELEFLNWLNKELPNLPKSSLETIDDLFKMYKEAQNKQKKDLIDNMLKQDNFSKVTGKNNTEYFVKNNYDNSTILVNRDNATLAEQIAIISPNDNITNTNKIVKKLGETKEEIKIKDVNDDNFSNENETTQANHIVATKLENEKNTQLLGNHDQGIYIDNITGKIIENIILEKANGKVNITSNELTLSTNMTEPTKSTEIDETNLVRKRVLKQNHRTGYINYYFLITITIICILVVMLLK